jgi:regulator of protease activity HflC (stomatin/prohibitin superfamily)
MLNDESKGTQALAEGGRDFLDPDSDGALLTADGYMVHARWQVTYRRKSDGAHITLEQIASDPEEEKDRESTERLIVAAAVRQAVVHAAAQMTVDEVLYDQTTPERRDKFRLIKSIAQAEAQHILDKMDLGIELQQFEPSKRIPPRFVIRSFNDVQSAQSRAGADRSKAQEEAAKRLAEAAGEGAPMILAQIDVYETQLAAGKADDAAATLQRIQDLMQRRTVSIDGKDVLATVSGDVSKRLSEAVQYQTSVVSRARSDASAYDAKLGAFRANPQVYLSGEWTAAYTKFASAETLQTMLLPPGLERLVLRINKDPEVDKRVKMMLAEQETMDAARDREKKRANEVHERRLEGTSLEGS